MSDQQLPDTLAALAFKQAERERAKEKARADDALARLAAAEAWVPKRHWLQGEEDGHYACSRCGLNLDDRDDADGEHTREECDAEVDLQNGYVSHMLGEYNRTLTVELVASEAALSTERDCHRVASGTASRLRGELEQERSAHETTRAELGLLRDVVTAAELDIAGRGKIPGRTALHVALSAYYLYLAKGTGGSTREPATCPRCSGSRRVSVRLEEGSPTAPCPECVFPGVL